MAKVFFGSLPDYALLGGKLAGVLSVETDKPLEMGWVSLKLTANEITQVTVQQPQPRGGSSSEVIIQTVPILEHLVDLAFPGSTLIGGSMSAPFSLDLPMTAAPSFATSAMPRTRGRMFSRRDGCYVEYALEARIDVPWWLDPVDREMIPVFSPRRVLGAIDPVRIPGDGARPTIMIDIDQPAILPGTPVTGSWQVMNPSGKHLRSMTVGLQRYSAWTVRGRPGQTHGPEYTATIPLDTAQPSTSGHFGLTVPNTVDATGPWQGALFQTYWNFTVALDIALGLDVTFRRPLRPV